MTDAERYAVTTRKVVVDGEELWRATVRELPDLAEFAESREEAIELALDAIESLKASAAEDGRLFPEPAEDEEDYSGRVTLRLPKSLHREIALKAQDEDVSLNSYIVTNLALALSERAAAAAWADVVRTVSNYAAQNYMVIAGQASNSQPSYVVGTVSAGDVFTTQWSQYGTHESTAIANTWLMGIGSVEPPTPRQGRFEVAVTARRRVAMGR